MEQLIEEFRNAYVNESGYDLALTLSPVAPVSNPNRLYSIYRSTNFAQAQSDILNRISYDNNLSQRLSVEEANGWADVFFAYWKAIGEILKAEEATKNNTQVSLALAIRLHMSPKVPSSKTDILKLFQAVTVSPQMTMQFILL